MKAIFNTTNNTKFAKNLEAGYCFGMSCDWARKSLTSQRGRGVYHKGQLEEFKWAIGQTAYEIKDSTDSQMIEGMGLLVKKYHKGNIISWADVCNKLTLLKGTYIFCISGKGGGHAMGFRNEKTTDVLGRSGTSIQWLDPNIGLMEFSDNQDFKNSGGTRLNNFYGTGEADPDERLDSTYEFFQVTT